MKEAKFPPIRGYQSVQFLGFGCGGRVVCSSVFIARKLETNALVAMTVSNQRGRDRFPGRADAAIQDLDHPNILRVIDVGVVEGCFYEAIEYVRLQTLAERLTQGVIPVTQALAVGSCLASALLYLRDRRVDVCCLSPNQILLSEEYVTKLHPGNLVKRAVSTQNQQFLGDMIGNLAFCPPEYLSGRFVEFTPTGEVYRLGAVIYAMLTGQSPFIGDNRVIIAKKVRSTPPVPLRHINPDVPEDLEMICAKCLDKVPERRYASVCHLLNALTGTRRTIESKRCNREHR